MEPARVHNEIDDLMPCTTANVSRLVNYTHRGVHVVSEIYLRRAESCQPVVLFVPITDTAVT